VRKLSSPLARCKRIFRELAETKKHVAATIRENRPFGLCRIPDA
jgi:hypothetical protein